VGKVGFLFIIKISLFASFFGVKDIFLLLNLYLSIITKNNSKINNFNPKIPGRAALCFP